MKWLDRRDPEEWVVVSVDFARLTPAGDTLDTPTVVPSVLRGTDATPGAVLSGSPQIVGTVVAQLMVGAVHGVDYKLRFQVQTSSGQRRAFAVAIPVRTA